ncbi:MAG: hypothetical protein K6F95_02755 [Selenomonas sp.]|uniref:hypothetical protein n=1 Tax=Selenomonas sp. TaxID=2053611 RepID=UPI0025D8249A|nr:hypothetical protein [Selenomonas sp.]MCR5756809.1 hypothetical protein [Selenomonas sp.]
MSNTKLIVIITALAFLLDCLLPDGMDMGAFLIIMGAWVTICGIKEIRKWKAKNY